MDWSEAIEIHKGETRHSHHNPQLWMGQQPRGWLPGQSEAGAAGRGAGCLAAGGVRTEAFLPG